FSEIAQLSASRKPHGKFGQMVVEKRHTRFKSMRHGQLVLDDQKAVEEGFGLEIEAVIDVILRPGERCSVLVEHTSEDVPRDDIADVVPDRRQYLLAGVLRQQPLPEREVLINIVFEVVIDDCTVVAPRIAAEQFVPSDPRKNYLNKL